MAKRVLNRSREPTIKQRRLVEALMGRASGNVAQAARLAGYSARSAGPNGFEALRNPTVQQLLQKRLAEIGDAMGSDEVLARVSEIARADMGEFLTPQGTLDTESLRQGKGRLVQSVDVVEIRNARGKVVGHTKRLKLHSSLKALGVLVRVRGLLKNTPPPPPPPTLPFELVLKELSIEAKREIVAAMHKVQARLAETADPSHGA